MCERAGGSRFAASKIMLSSAEQFVARVAALAGVGTDCAERATHAVLSSIATYLASAERELVAAELPPVLGAALASPALDEDVFARSLTAGHARELVASVCRAMAEELSFEAIDAIRIAVPPAMAILFGPPGSVNHQRPLARVPS